MKNFIVLTGIVLGVWIYYRSLEFNVKNWSFADRPELIGPLAPKNIFSDAELLLKDELFGPESVAVLENAIYITDDSGLVKIVDGKKVKTVPICLKKCGRPLGLRHLKDEIFIIADAELGILSVEFESGKIETLLPSSTVIEGRTIHYANDLDFINNETIIFSVSTRWQTEQFTNGLLEFANDGRIFTLNIKTKEYKLIRDNLQFANGLQVHSDKQSILICETSVARISRYYFTGPKQGQLEIFSDNLPCFPDNIRNNLKGNFFVACGSTRIPDQFGFMDFIASSPNLRRLILAMTPGKLGILVFVATIQNYGLFLELDGNGQIIDSWHDPTGKIKLISQVTETSDAIYLGSYAHEFLAKIKK
uniref:Strictosidine synthase conserved region domain-containing protein n=1 Tax=Panagrolaimus sp. JU765 TaxID=591449 RepID=A0AC34PZP5_9BILA